jgi:hypothetical protein
MLTGAVAGAVFASPPVRAILEAIMQIGKNNKGNDRRQRFDDRLCKFYNLID